MTDQTPADPFHNGILNSVPMVRDIRDPRHFLIHSDSFATPGPPTAEEIAAARKIGPGHPGVQAAYKAAGLELEILPGEMPTAEYETERDNSWANYRFVQLEDATPEDVANSVPFSEFVEALDRANFGRDGADVAWIEDFLHGDTPEPPDVE
ncbi:MAG: hypothetical protein M3N46_02630 [Actinomycetota bacterium]|nr:hypothetical protein [Actinomycetota bacterium]